MLMLFLCIPVRYIKINEYEFTRSVKNQENIYRSNVQVTFELCGDYRYLYVLYSK